MENLRVGRNRPPISAASPIGSPALIAGGFLDNAAQSYRSNHLRASSPSNVQRLANVLQNKPQNGDEPPLLKRYKVDFTPDEPITHLVAGLSRVVVATKDKKILLIDTKTNEQSVCDIGRYYGSRLSQIKIYRIFLDPTGKFLLISLAQAIDNQPYENLLYVKQLQSLQKLKNHLITAVAWNHPKLASTGAASIQSYGSNSTGTILLGTSKGLVLQTEFSYSDESKFFPLKTGPGQYVKEIFDVGSDMGAITGVEYHQVSSGGSSSNNNNNDNSTSNNNSGNSNSGEKGFVILLSTNNRLYRMVGSVPANVDPPPLQTIMAQNATNYKDVPGRFSNSKLDLHYPQTPSNSLPTRFAWLTEPGVMTSELHDSIMTCRSSFESNEEMNIIPYNSPEDVLAPLSSSTPTGAGFSLGSMSPQFSPMGNYYDKPISMVVTNFHVIVLMRHCIRAICILNNLTVYEEYFSMNYGEIQGMSKDLVKNIVWVYFKRAIFRYKVSMENKNVWKIFLEQRRFELAKKYSAGDKANYDRVVCEEAQHYFKSKDFNKSAEMFARSKKPFEDVALMFMHANCSRALNRYLMIRLDEFDAIGTQLTMTLAWLFERLISSITILESGDQEQSDKRDELGELRADLDQLLDSRQVIACIRKYPNTFYSIIQNYANWKILIRVAKLAGDHEQLLRIYMNLRDYSEALEVLRRVKRADLFYTHGHLIMKHRPKELVDAMIEQPDIEAHKLIPILIQENPYHNKSCETIRYLEHCVRTLQTDSKVIHNYLFELYARYRDEETLIEYLEEEISAAQSQAACHLDLQSCLRQCFKLKLMRTCVVIYSHMGFYDEAVNLALEFDVQLAKDIARRVDSEDHQKRLWLAIAKSALNKQADIELATQLLDESEKLLKIEDVLIFFPDYKTVDQIKQALHQSLAGKRNEIKTICDGAFETIAERIRSEIRTFKVRYSKLKCGQKCEICSGNIMSRSHYLFPCGHLFHYDCIIKEIVSIDPQYQQIEEKLKQLAADSVASGSGSAPNQLHKQLSSSYTRHQSLSLSSFSSQSKLAPFISIASNNSNGNGGAANQAQAAASTPPIDKRRLADELYEITSKECIYCGDFLANYIDRPAALDSAYADDSIQPQALAV